LGACEDDLFGVGGFRVIVIFKILTINITKPLLVGFSFKE
jgi:hypothetical protein